jgi:hypothetical protein
MTNNDDGRKATPLHLAMGPIVKACQPRARPLGLPTGDARTPDSAKTAQCLVTWYKGSPYRA